MTHVVYSIVLFFIFTSIVSNNNSRNENLYVVYHNVFHHVNDYECDLTSTSNCYSDTKVKLAVQFDVST